MRPLLDARHMTVREFIAAGFGWESSILREACELNADSACCP
jgi:hypothetical protein